MKKLGILLTFVGMLAMVSCNSASSLASDSVAVAAGSSCGQALKSLFNSYQSTGKLDLTSGNNLSNALIVATSYANLRANKDNSAYKTSFTTGMVTGGASIINTGNAATLTSKLLESTGLSGVNSSNIAQKAETVSAIIQLLQVLK